LLGLSSAIRETGRSVAEEGAVDLFGAEAALALFALTRRENTEFGPRW
jgi:hypothetical protein